MNQITLYSNHCPKCTVLEKKLDAKGVTYKEVNDVNEMLSLGITTVPRLMVDGELLDFSEANEWIKSLEVSR